ncbi:MAG: hypothetical protein AB7E52_08445 [Bdellovibrionales bacterium]
MPTSKPTISPSIHREYGDSLTTRGLIGATEGYMRNMIDEVPDEGARQRLCERHLGQPTRFLHHTK